MSSVLVSPFFSTVSSAPRLPSCRTMLVCTAKPSRTCATSLMKTTDAVRRADRQIVQRGNLAGRAVQSSPRTRGRRCARCRPAESGSAARSRSKHRSAERCLRVQQVGVGIDHDLPHLAAIGQRNRGALHIRQPRPDEAETQVVQVRLAQALRRDSASCTIGTDDASYFRCCGGKVPGGSTRRMVCTTAVICADASSTFTFGWKYTRMTETPW